MSRFAVIHIRDPRRRRETGGEITLVRSHMRCGYTYAPISPHTTYIVYYMDSTDIPRTRCKEDNKNIEVRNPRSLVSLSLSFLCATSWFIRITGIRTTGWAVTCLDICTYTHRVYARVSVYKRIAWKIRTDLHAIVITHLDKDIWRSAERQKEAKKMKKVEKIKSKEEMCCGKCSAS